MQVGLVIFKLFLCGVPANHLTASIFQAYNHSANQSPQFVTDTSGLVSGALAVRQNLNLI